ncbi:NACHT domain-containing protein [Streptomyces sp. NBC_00124]|uniref:NACHT domain-containing protein n=1 Tax=Streptomyces sp. NBC_00124 TaxID=2975662 RepID=UPI00224D216A|nr:NACHT domain-containing protein [Streptomyces sp. NBC_00124]MCX5357181.1 NACHT domain-containing protein [Streptomyces sp. NBC_00124]
MVGLGGRRHRRMWQFICGVCLVLIVASATFTVRQLLHGGLKADEPAGLLALPAGVIGLVAAILALRKPIEGNDAELARGWAQTLARQIETSEGEVRRQLLGADTQRINLAYTLRPSTERAATAPAAGRTFDGTDSLPAVLDYYKSTRPRRLLITGAAGAGKTVLALELMLTLIKNRADDDLVPVRIPLAQWDTTQPLETLLIQRLTDAYDWPSKLAAGLVRQGLVLPVLDGLDEMDPLRDDETPDPDAPRAHAVLEALNAYINGGLDAGPLVVTCRTAHYDALAPSAVLIDAAHVSIAPVDAEHAVTYLRTRARDTPRWQPLLDHLHGQPTGPLATVLSTPWRLCLAATVYHRTGDPAELLQHPTSVDLDQHLLARYIPAATTHTPNPLQYHPEAIHRWLHHLTHHLSGTTTGIPAIDITLHRVWPLAGPTRVRATDAALAAVAAVVVVIGATITQGVSTGTITAIALTVGAAAFFASSPSPGRLTSFRSGSGLAARLPVGLGVGLLTAVVTVIFAVYVAGAAAGGGHGSVSPMGLTTTLTIGLGTGIPVGLAAALTAGLTGEPTDVSSPRAIIRDDIVCGLAVGLGAGFTFALWVGLFTGFGFTRGLTTGFTFSLEYWLPVGLPAGLLYGLAYRMSAARRYGAFLLCSRGRLPFRLGVFLDWAVRTGLLRYSGTAYQFRHRELQQWLTQSPRGCRWCSS